MVIIFHWIPNAHHFILPFGSWGVELFFVLSGFLITKVLLESREAAESKKESKGSVIRKFLLRRSLRIFPIYYLSLVVILLFDRTNVSGVRDNLFYFFGYASNFLYFKTQQFNFPVAHFWSLAVEEQFYLVWPWFVLFLPWRYVKPFLWCSIVFGIVSRIYLITAFPSSTVTADVLTPTCFDGFSIGGLFAFYTVKHKSNIEETIRRINIAGLATFLLMLVFLITDFNKLSVLHRTLDSIFFLALIANAYKGYTGIAGKVANNRTLIFLGQISYGLYIYHLLTPWLTGIVLNVVSRIKTSLVITIVSGYRNATLFPRFTYDFLILLIVSTASWYLVEKPINKFKYYFR